MRRKFSAVNGGVFSDDLEFHIRRNKSCEGNSISRIRKTIVMTDGFDPWKAVFFMVSPQFDCAAFNLFVLLGENCTKAATCGVYYPTCKTNGFSK
jgi:hypothetical protein